MALAACAPAATWEHNARPLIARSCAGCHDGSNDLPPRVTPAQVAERADVALALMEARIMPPSVVDKSGACGDFKGPQPPTDDEIALFAEWIEAGAPVDGDPLSAAGARPRPTIDVALPAFTPEGSTLLPRDDHRCFAIDAPGAYLTSIGASGSPALHHVLVFSVPEGASIPSSTWECPGAIGIPGAELVGVWAPGAPSSRYPEGSGAKLNSRMVAQLHTAIGVDVVEATLSFGVTDNVERELAFIPAATTSFALPPERERVEHSAIIAPLPTPSDVLAVFPHMHVAGRSLTLSRASGECLVNTPRWRYGAQEVAAYEEPVAIDAREELRITCVWNTQDRDDTTRFGEGTLDEMCTVFLLTSL